MSDPMCWEKLRVIHHQPMGCCWCRSQFDQALHTALQMALLQELSPAHQEQCFCSFCIFAKRFAAVPGHSTLDWRPVLLEDGLHAFGITLAMKFSWSQFGFGWLLVSSAPHRSFNSPTPNLYSRRGPFPKKNCFEKWKPCKRCRPRGSEGGYQCWQSEPDTSGGQWWF